MAQIDLPKYVVTKKRAGGLAYYFRRFETVDGKRKPNYTRLPHPLDPAFGPAYNSALNSEGGPKPGTVDAMIAAFLKSPRFLKKVQSASAQSKYREAFRRLSSAYGPALVRDVSPQRMLGFVEAQSETPAMANRVKSCCSVMWKWAIPRGLATANPCEHIEWFDEPEEGGPWPIPAVEKAVWEMKAHIAAAVALAFYTAQRKGDLIRWAPRMISGRSASFRQQKTGQLVTVTLNDDAMRILEATWPKDDDTPFLRGARGQQWTGQTFTDAFAKERARIGLDPSLKFHGLRHTAAELVAEKKPDLVPALLGHADQRTSERYTKNARQRRDAREASKIIPILSPGSPETRVPD